MSKFILLFVIVFFFGITISAPALAAEQNSEPTKCYEIAWGNQEDGKGFGLSAGQAVKLCGGTTNAQKVLQCFAKAWSHPNNSGLGLTAGQAVDLCKTNSLP